MVEHDASGADWHRCARWGRYGLQCPFQELSPVEDRETGPWPPAWIYGLIGRRRDPERERVYRAMVDEEFGRGRAELSREARYGAMAEAEALVSGAADAIPVFSGG